MEIHEGHRQRMYEKLKNNDNLYDHEVLEILLYNVYSRKDTNPIAHALLQRFPSIAAIFKAEVDELMAVDGVGKQTALYLKCIGRCFDYVNDTDSFAVVKTRADLINFAKMRLEKSPVEKFELYAMDKNGKVVRIKTISTGEFDKVSIPPDDIMRFITLVKPDSLYIAHNHVNRLAEPSAADNDCTKQVQLVCSMNNVQFKDHMIYSNISKPYSYYETGLLQAIQNNFSIGSLLDNAKWYKPKK